MQRSCNLWGITSGYGNLPFEVAFAVDAEVQPISVEFWCEEQITAVSYDDASVVYGMPAAPISARIEQNVMQHGMIGNEAPPALVKAHMDVCGLEWLVVSIQQAFVCRYWLYAIVVHVCNLGPAVFVVAVDSYVLAGVNDTRAPTILHNDLMRRPALAIVDAGTEEAVVMLDHYSGAKRRPLIMHNGAVHVEPVLAARMDRGYHGWVIKVIGTRAPDPVQDAGLAIGAPVVYLVWPNISWCNPAA